MVPTRVVVLHVVLEGVLLYVPHGLASSCSGTFGGRHHMHRRCALRGFVGTKRGYHCLSVFMSTYMTTGEHLCLEQMHEQR